ncbi:hypothetical protein D3C84_1006740 [compost metagenome]
MSIARHDHITARFERRQVTFLADAACPFFAVVAISGAQWQRVIVQHLGAKPPRLPVNRQQPITHFHDQHRVLLIVHAQRAKTQRIEGRQVAKFHVRPSVDIDVFAVDLHRAAGAEIEGTAVDHYGAVGLHHQN